MRCNIPGFVLDICMHCQAGSLFSILDSTLSFDADAFAQAEYVFVFVQVAERKQRRISPCKV